MYKRIVGGFTPCFLIMLLNCVGGFAEVIVDTGVPTNTDIQWSFHGNTISEEWFAGRFTLTQSYRLTDISLYLTPRYAGTVTVAIYAGTGAPKLGAELYTGTFQGTQGGATGWYGISGLGWTLSPGTYWVAFEARRKDNYYSTLPSVVPSPMEGWAVYNPSSDLNSYSVLGSSFSGFGVRVLGTPKAANGNWFSLQGPEGGYIHALAIDPTNPQTIYAGTGGGVYKSSDGGGSWRPAVTGLTGYYVQALAVDPTSTQTLYAGVYFKGVFKSTNGGNTWSAVNTGLGNSGVLALAVDPASPQVVYAGTAGSGIFKSTNGGSSWSGASKGMTNLSVRALALDPVSPQILYCGTEGGGVFKSTDGGGSWNAVNTGLTTMDVHVLAIDPTSTQTLYAGTWNGGVFKSTNGGSSWSHSGLNGYQSSALAIDATSPQKLYTGTTGGLFKSTNGGGSWSAANAGMTDAFVYSLAIDPTSAQTLYAGTYGAGVFKSTNGGGSWSVVRTGMSAATVNGLAMDATSPKTLYAGTSAGVFKSSNQGASWTSINAGLNGAYVSAIVLDSTLPQTLYAGTYLSGMYKSTNGGATWGAINSGLTTAAIAALAIDPASPQTLYAGTSGGGVFKSTNGGGFWSAMNTNLTSSFVNTLAIDPKSPQTVYAGTYFGGVFKSTNGGGNWNAVTPGLKSYNVTFLAIDPVSPEIVYAGASRGGVFKSTDGGNSWSAANTGLADDSVMALAIDPTSTQTLYVGSDYAGGVFKSTNAGGNWSAINSGLDSTNVLALLLDPTSPQNIYAGTAGGVWGYGTCLAPAKPRLISPAGNVTASPTYSWNAVDGAEQYQLWVNDSSANGKIQQWYTAAQSGCASGTGICSITPSTTLMAGAATWWIRAWNSCDGGSYSPWSDGMNFRVVPGGIPGKATLISPSGNISTTNPAYTWNAVPTATWYQLWVNSGSASPLIKEWYTTADAGCVSGTGTCSVTPTTSLTLQSGQWWIQTWNDSGYGPWSDGMAFTLATALPPQAKLISPSGSIAAQSPTYIWNAAATSTWYYLWVNDLSGRALVQIWYTAAQAGCASGTGNCSVTPAVTLPKGASYLWWIQTWNPSGYGPWSSSLQFSLPLQQTIAVINPDNYRILKFGYLDWQYQYRSMAYGEIADNQSCSGGRSNPACWTGVGSQQDFIGTILAGAGYRVDYYTAANMPAITPSDYDLVIIQDPMTQNYRSFDKTVENTLPDLLQYAISPTFVSRILGYFNAGGKLLLVGDAVRMLENATSYDSARLNFGKTILSSNLDNVQSYPSSTLPAKWLFVHGGPFCGVDRHGSGTYTVEASSLLNPGTKLSDISLFDGNDFGYSLTWSDTVYYPSDGTSLLSVRVQGTGDYVLRGDVCQPPEYTDTVNGVMSHFMGYTTISDRKIYYIGSDSFFDYRVRDYEGTWHAGSYLEIRNTTTAEGKQAIVAIVQRALQ